MKTREEILAYGLTFADTYVDTPFSDTNWQLVRVKQSKKHFCGSMRKMVFEFKCKSRPGVA